MNTNGHEFIEERSLVVGSGYFGRRPRSSLSHPACDLTHALENDFRHEWFSAHTRSVPDKFALFFAGISPGRLAILKSLLNDSLRLPQQHRDILSRMHPVTDEEWHHHDVLGLRQLIAGTDARFFFQKDGLDVRA